MKTATVSSTYDASISIRWTPKPLNRRVFHRSLAWRACRDLRSSPLLRHPHSQLKSLKRPGNQCCLSEAASSQSTLLTARGAHLTITRNEGNLLPRLPPAAYSFQTKLHTKHSPKRSSSSRSIQNALMRKIYRPRHHSLQLYRTSA